MNQHSSSQAAPIVECEQLHPSLPVSDIPAAVDFYTKKLGFAPRFTWGDPPTMAGVSLGDVSVHLMLREPATDPAAAADSKAKAAATATKKLTGCSVYFIVGDADELHEFHRDNGVEIVIPPAETPYSMRDYRVRDPYGNELGFGHPIYHVGEPVRIERVDVQVRLEKRLAALLRDLADHKRMSLTSCLEEILLHTCEPYGDGVASPHTKSDLRHIQRLRQKHGIDYDCHASYRFVEDHPGK